MEKIVLREIMKVMLWVVSPLIIVTLLFLDKPLELGIAFIIGVLLGVLRLKALFRYIICTVNNVKPIKNKANLVKYLASWIFTLGALGFVLIKTTEIGLAMLAGILSVPIAIMIYAFKEGISNFRKK